MTLIAPVFKEEATSNSKKVSAPSNDQEGGFENKDQRANSNDFIPLIDFLEEKKKQRRRKEKQRLSAANPVQKAIAKYETTADAKNLLSQLGTKLNLKA